jgi:hypothetical protein
VRYPLKVRTTLIGGSGLRADFRVPDLPSQSSRPHTEGAADDRQHKNCAQQPSRYSLSFPRKPQTKQRECSEEFYRYQGNRRRTIVLPDNVFGHAGQIMNNSSRPIACQVHRDCQQRRNDEDSEACFLDLITSPKRRVKQKQESEERTEDRDVVEQQMYMSGTHDVINYKISPCFYFEPIVA